MATFASITINGNLINDPTCKEFSNGSSLWNFTFAMNAKDKESKSDATIWLKVNYNAPADDKFMLGLKKGSCVMVSGKLPYSLNQYSASYSANEGKYSMNLAIDAYGVTRGFFDSKKTDEQKETKEDNLVPPDKWDFKIPKEIPERPKF
jgi:single-stranded DNA-binding protein